MDLEKRDGRPRPEPAPEGCLVAAIRLPLRILMVVLVVPVRLVWDALAAAGRFVGRWLLLPLARASGWVLYGLLVWPCLMLWRYVLAPIGRGLRWLGRVLLVVPAVWLYAHVLAPVGRALRDYVLAPLGRGLAWLVRVLVVVPLLALWRYVLVPVGRVLGVVLREIRDALCVAWRIAGYVSRAVGRALRWLIVDPLRWVYRTVLTPAGHVVRDYVLRPLARVAASARAAARQARADVRRALFGTPPRPEPQVSDQREPGGSQGRSLDGSTTALTQTAFIKD
ncbi:hypothetical protein [Streptomyces sp. NPDC002790]|uniref:hypothetical protein n=1 Tax=Streptomyces sp. NPDC002790 TaxID=3154431 RepID=UPI00332AA5CC